MYKWIAAKASFVKHYRVESIALLLHTTATSIHPNNPPRSHPIRPHTPEVDEKEEL